MSNVLSAAQHICSCGQGTHKAASRFSYTRPTIKLSNIPSFTSLSYSIIRKGHLKFNSSLFGEPIKQNIERVTSQRDHTKPRLVTGPANLTKLSVCSTHFHKERIGRQFLKEVSTINNWVDGVAKNQSIKVRCNVAVFV